MPRTILLADDSVTIQKVVELTFMEQDYQVVAVSDGATALAKLSGLTPDLVIADVHMPGGNGYEVCRQVKQSHPQIPVLLLVGTFEQFDEQQAAAAGADSHLKKPFDSQDLLRQVETLIGQAGAGPAAAPAAAPPAVEQPPPAADDLFEPLAEAPEPGEPVLDDPFEAMPEVPAPAAPVFEEPLLSAPAPTPVAEEPLLTAPPPVPIVEEPLLTAPAPVPVFEEPALAELEPPELLAAETAPGESPGAAASGSAGVDTRPTEARTFESVEPLPEPVPAAPDPPPVAAPAAAAAPAASSEGSGNGPLAEEDLERIAQRVAELVGERMVREVAWEVVPDLAEVLIKERIRELESQVE